MFWIVSIALALLGITKGQTAFEAVSDTVEEHLDSWTQYDSLFQKYAAMYGVEDWRWLKAIALNESSLGKAPSVARGLEAPWDIEGSKSSDGKSWGLMQVTMATGRWLDPNCTEEKLNNPEYSIKLAADLFTRNQKLFSRLDSQWLEYVVKSYNQGAGNTKKEIASGKGYANEYWARFNRNFERVTA
jgi:membrane-bound lytic murein transglycosylase MltF